jgi:hypothetical protein
MKYSYIGQKNIVFKKNDLLFFKTQQMRNNNLIKKKIENFEDETDDFVMNNDEEEDKSKIQNIYVDVFKINDKYNIYKGSNLKKNHPPLSPYQCIKK